MSLVIDENFSPSKSTILNDNVLHYCKTIFCHQNFKVEMMMLLIIDVKYFCQQNLQAEMMALLIDVKKILVRTFRNL